MPTKEIIFIAKRLTPDRWEAFTKDNQLIVSGFKKKEDLLVECRALAKYKYPECERVVVEFVES